MSNQNEEVLGVNLICITAITIWILGLISNIAHVINLDFLNTYYIAYYGSDIAQFTKVLVPIWLLLDLVYSAAAFLALRRHEIGRKLIVLVALFHLILHLTQQCIGYFLGNTYFKAGIVADFALPGYYGVLSIVIIYYFTRPKVKEQFK